jgi:hypothetical protein
MEGDAAGWPVVLTRVRGMLRILADPTCEPVSGSGAADGTTVAVTLEDGSTREFTIEGRPIGTGDRGRGARPRALLPGRMRHDARRSGPAWRDDAALPGSDPKPRGRRPAGPNRLAVRGSRAAGA